MIVTVVFPGGQEVRWSFAANHVPRTGDKLRITDRGDDVPPQEFWRVKSVVWLVTERGCGEAWVHVG